MRARLLTPFALLVLSLVGRAAAVPGEVPSTVLVEPDEEPEPAYVPAAADLVGGHLSLSAAPAIATIFGGFGERLPAHDLKLGYAVSADLAFGISRYVELGVWGQYLTHQGASQCPTCSAKSYAIGPFARYHPVQGTRFDPWVLVGAGYRGADTTRGTVDARLSGVEWLRVGLGGDYYATSSFNLGPWVEFELSSLFASGSSTGALRGSIVTGISLGFDVPGR